MVKLLTSSAGAMLTKSIAVVAENLWERIPQRLIWDCWVPHAWSLGWIASWFLNRILWIQDSFKSGTKKISCMIQGLFTMGPASWWWGKKCSSLFGDASQTEYIWILDQNMFEIWICMSWRALFSDLCFVNISGSNGFNHASWTSYCMKMLFNFLMRSWWSF